MKIELATIVSELSKNGIEKPVINRIVEGLQAKVKHDDEGDEPKDKRKTQFVVVVSDPEGKIKENGHVAWVGQVEEEVNPAVFMERIKKAAFDFNASKKGRLLPVQTIGEALENVPRKFYKVVGEKTLVKTKTPVLVLLSNNKLQ